jgi:cytochrome c553
MKKTVLLSIVVLMLAATFGLIFNFSSSTITNAQTADAQKMPEVITLAKDAKLGPVTFNHAKHNNGEYKVNNAAIGCTTCHHTAAPAAEVAKCPPYKLAWPTDRTTTLTAELFTKDPKAAGVAACRDCHAKADAKPKLMDAMPTVKPEGASAPVVLNNMQAFHKSCAGCHTDQKKANPAFKGPTTAQCVMCHKKAA